MNMNMHWEADLDFKTDMETAASESDANTKEGTRAEETSEESSEYK